MLSKLGIEVIDAHVHFITYDTTKAWLSNENNLKRMRQRVRFQTDMGQEFKLPEKAWDTGKLWIDEMDKYGITAIGMMIGEAAWSEFLKARDRYPGRFLAYAMIDPTKDNAVDLVRKAGKDQFQGIKLYPSTMPFPVYSEQVKPIFEEALKQKLLVILHFGVTIGSTADLRHGNPIDIQKPANDFPDLNFMIAHFGAGFLRETLLLMYQTHNVVMDTSGSNIWMQYHPGELNLEKVFHSAIQAGGACRVIFGTDSSFFPRGYRYNILEAQVRAVNALESRIANFQEERNLIFKENILRLTGFKPARID